MPYSFSFLLNITVKFWNFLVCSSNWPIFFDSCLDQTNNNHERYDHSCLDRRMGFVFELMELSLDRHQVLLLMWLQVYLWQLHWVCLSMVQTHVQGIWSQWDNIKVTWMLFNCIHESYQPVRFSLWPILKQLHINVVHTHTSKDLYRFLHKSI